MPSTSPNSQSSQLIPPSLLFPSVLGSAGKIRSTNNSRSVTPRLSQSPTRARIRPRLTQHHTIDDAVSLLKSSNKIMILTGAGISTSLGIPDFRSSTGLYTILQAAGYDDPQELFHIDNFLTNPSTFWESASMIIPRIPEKGPNATLSQPRYSTTHAFLAVLQAKDKLLTNYTQNIDGLELVAGIKPEKLIHCHGNWSTATCITCSKSVPAKKYLPIVYQENVPFCKCSQLAAAKKSARKPGKKRKRHDYEDSDASDDNTRGPTGLLKPDITFFGEGIPRTYLPRLKDDKEAVDLLIIIGTSLKVQPVNEIPLAIPQHVPQIWISKERCQRDGVKVDVELLGECDIIIQELCRRAGWLKSLLKFSWKAPGEKVSPEIGLQQRTEPIVTIGPGQVKPDPHVEKECPKQATEPPVLKRSLPIRTTSSDKAEALSHTAITYLADVGKSLKSAAGQVKTDTLSLNLTSITPALVELEEGTDWRWFVRRPKPLPRGDSQK